MWGFVEVEPEYWKIFYILFNFFTFNQPVVPLDSVLHQASAAVFVGVTSVFCSPSAAVEFVAVAVEVVGVVVEAEDDAEDWEALGQPEVEAGSAVLAFHLFLELEF